MIAPKQLRKPLYLCAVSQVLYALFCVQAINCTVRELLFSGICAAVATSFFLGCFLALAKYMAQISNACVFKLLAFFIVGLILIIGMVQTVLQQLWFYHMQFGTGHLWAIFLCVCVCCLPCTPNALVRCAGVLLVFCVVTSAICMIGFMDQSSPKNLSYLPLSSQGVYQGFWLAFLFCPEYFLLLFCTEKVENSPNDADYKAEYLSFFTLPFLMVILQSVLFLCSELVFGTPQIGVGGFEFLRSWAFLNFSRFDGVVVLLCLLLLYYRLRFLWFWVVRGVKLLFSARRVGVYDES